MSHGAETGGGGNAELPFFFMFDVGSFLQMGGSFLTEALDVLRSGGSSSGGAKPAAH